MSFFGYRKYVPVAQRRAKAAKELAKLKKHGRAVSPVAIEGRTIARSFWGNAWCDNLERYSDFANRLPRGRTYVNNGSVIDLQIARGKVAALVSGSEIYRVKIDIAVAAPARWKAICADCAGSVGSIVELLQGKLSKHVMERVCRETVGLFPAPKEIKMSCSCPDWAGMCKHVAATLYGVGARLDHDPDLLFTLRGVNRSELVSAGADLSITEAAAGCERVLVDDDVAALFGLEFDAAPPAAVIVGNRAPATERATTKAGQANSPSAPARSARDRTTRAASEPKPQAAKSSASKSGRAASTTKAQLRLRRQLRAGAPIRSHEVRFRDARRRREKRAGAETQGKIEAGAFDFGQGEQKGASRSRRREARARGAGAAYAEPQTKGGGDARRGSHARGPNGSALKVVRRRGSRLVDRVGVAENPLAGARLRPADGIGRRQRRLLAPFSPTRFRAGNDVHIAGLTVFAGRARQIGRFARRLLRRTHSDRRVRPTRPIGQFPVVGGTRRLRQERAYWEQAPLASVRQSKLGLSRQSRSSGHIS